MDEKVYTKDNFFMSYQFTDGIQQYNHHHHLIYREVIILDWIITFVGYLRGWTAKRKHPFHLSYILFTIPGRCLVRWTLYLKLNWIRVNIEVDVVIVDTVLVDLRRTKWDVACIELPNIFPHPSYSWNSSLSLSLFKMIERKWGSKRNERIVFTMLVIQKCCFHWIPSSPPYESNLWTLL